MRLSEKEAAQYLGITYQTIASWRRDGVKAGEIKIPYSKIGGHYFYTEADLRTFLASCRVGGAG